MPHISFQPTPPVSGAYRRLRTHSNVRVCMRNYMYSMSAGLYQVAPLIRRPAHSQIRGRNVCNKRGVGAMAIQKLTSSILSSVALLRNLDPRRFKNDDVPALLLFTNPSILA